METSKDFARSIKIRYNITSDYALAKLLGITRSTMSLHKTGNVKSFGEDTGFRIAELLDLDAGYVLSCLAAERSKDAKVKKVWERLAALTRVAVLLPAVLAVTILAGSPDVTAHATSVYYVKLLRWLARLLGVTAPRGTTSNVTQPLTLTV